MAKPWDELGRDLHHLGISVGPEIARELYKKGWRKKSEDHITILNPPSIVMTSKPILDTYHQAAAISFPSHNGGLRP